MSRNFEDVFDIYSVQLNYEILFLYIFFILFIPLSVFILFKFFPFKLVKSLFKREKIKINISDPKDTAYKLTFLIYKIDTPYNEELLKKLEKYKYKKKVVKFDKETLELIEKFLEKAKKYVEKV